MTMARLRIMLLGCSVAMLLALGGMPAGAAWGASSPVIVDCVHHLRLTRHYSVTQLEQALKTMPADDAQYTDCPDVIRSQLLAQLGARRGGAALRGADSQGSGFPVWAVAAIALVALGAIASAAAAAARRRGSRLRG